MLKMDKIYEGKAKMLYTTDDPDMLIQYFKDDATAFNAAKRGIVENKGVINNRISTKLFNVLSLGGVPTHFEKHLSDREMLIKKVIIIPLEVIVRNRSAGSLCRNFGIKEGHELKVSILEFSYKRDDLNDPQINNSQIIALGIATEAELEKIKRLTNKVNEIMKDFFAGHNLELIDFKLEFGKYKGEIILADEISPDTCRLWDMRTGEKMDKDRFRHDMGNIVEAYQEVLSRVDQ